MLFSSQYLTIIAVLLPFFTTQANCCGDPRSRAAMETEINRGHQPQPGDRLSRPSKPVDCYSGEEEFAVSAQGRRILAPCRFSKATTEHLKNILASESTNHPFALDVDHAHLAVTAEVWDEKYRNLPRDEILPALLRDTSLVAIYHLACHTPIADRKTAGTIWRSFAGFYDGRRIEKLPSSKAGSDPTQAQYYRTFAWFYTSVNKSTGLDHSAQGKSAAIEIFFDDDFQKARLPDRVNVSAREK